MTTQPMKPLGSLSPHMLKQIACSPFGLLFACMMILSACMSSEADDNPMPETNADPSDSSPEETTSVTVVPAQVTKMMHININVSDYNASKAFYEQLGFRSVFETEDKADAEAAAGLGMPPYELKATPMQLPDGSMLDLIEWTDPVDSRSPYEHVNHRGINRVALLTTQLDALLEKVDAERGTAFSAPVRRNGPDGEYRSVILRDLDGTLLELVEFPSEELQEEEEPRVVGYYAVYINTSDLAKSVAFYQALGFSVESQMTSEGDGSLAGAYKLDAFEYQSAYLALSTGPGIIVQEWAEPYNDGMPYDAMNHLGIARMALETADLEGDIVSLEKAGYTFYSDPIQPEGMFSFLRYVCLEDPDGAVMELVELNLSR